MAWWMHPGYRLVGRVQCIGQGRRPAQGVARAETVERVAAQLELGNSSVELLLKMIVTCLQLLNTHLQLPFLMKRVGSGPPNRYPHVVHFYNVTATHPDLAAFTTLFSSLTILRQPAKVRFREKPAHGPSPHTSRDARALRGL